MATINASVLSLADWAKRLDPDGRVPAIVELLSQTNEILTDMLWMQGNLETGHRTTIRTGLPAVAWRLINKGVPVGKSTTAQVTEQCGMMEARSQLDKALAELSSDLAGFRLSESQAFMEAMNQEMASTLFYGNSGLAPEEFTGLSPRYSALSGAGNSRNVLTGSGSGSDNTSIWLIVWGALTVHGIFPKNSKAGLIHEDLGIGDAFDADNNRFRAYMDLYRWNCGIALRDWRFAVRIPNIDVSNLVAKSSAADLIELMIKAIHRIPSLKMGKPCFYMNRTVFQMLDIQRRDEVITAGGGIQYEKIDGMSYAHFRGIPIRICDALVETEAAVA